MTWDTRKQTTVGLIAVILLFLGIGVFGFRGSLAGAVIAEGRIALETHSQVVQHPDGGVVEEILVRDGDRVNAGDVLLRLDGSELRSDLAVIDNQLIEFRARAARMKAERFEKGVLVFPAELRDIAGRDSTVGEILDGQRAVFDAGRRSHLDSIDSIREQQRQIRNEIEGLRALGAALAEQKALAIEDQENASSLFERGLIQAMRVSDLKRSIASLTGQAAQAEASIAANLAEIARLDVEVLRLVSARQERAVTDLRDVESRILELGEQKSVDEKQISRLDLRAPRDGVVQGLQIHTVGAVIRAADPVLSIVPQDKLFTILAKIDAHHVDSVFAGQAAVLRFASFDARTTPEIEATVKRVSADIDTDSRTGAQFYTAELVATPGEIDRLGDKELLPGMPVEVYIQTEERSPLSYMLKPFLDYVETAFRE